MQSEATTSVSAIASEWPSVTKLPAKFSHKWKNRTSVNTTENAQSTATVTAQAAPNGTHRLNCFCWSTSDVE